MRSPPTPDPSVGVFETLLVVAGEPVELATHLDRLRASVERLYAAPLPADAAQLVVSGALGLELGRLRLTVTPRDGRVDATVAATAIDAAIVFPGWERGPDLRTRTVAGWEGAHKWADRELLEALEAEASPASPLLVDGDGAVLETTRANLFVVRADGRIATPPTDGRILPGVARMRALEIARAAGFEPIEAAIGAEDLAAASEVFLTGSVRGVEPVRSIDGATVGHPRQSVADAVATGLHERWIGAQRPAPPHLAV